MHEIHGQEPAHRHDVLIQAGAEIQEGLARGGTRALQRIRTLSRTHPGVQVLHACREVCDVPLEPVHGTEAGKLLRQVGMRHDHPRPRSSKKPPEGGGDPVEQQVGKGIKLVIHQRHDRRAIPPQYCL